MAVTHFSGAVNSTNGFQGGSYQALDGTVSFTVANTTGIATFANTPVYSGGIQTGTIKSADGVTAITLANTTGAATFPNVATLTSGAKTGTIQSLDGVTGATIANTTAAYTFANNATFSNGITLADAKNIVVNTTTGTKIGTATSQKLGFFNATPVVQPATTGTTTGFTAATGTNVLSGSTFTGNTGSAAYTIGDIVLALKNVGLLAA